MAEDKSAKQCGYQWHDFHTEFQEGRCVIVYYIDVWNWNGADGQGSKQLGNRVPHEP
jgi:hypothetical protein